MPTRAFGCTLLLLLLFELPGFAQFAPNRYILLLQDPPVASRFPRREQMQSAPAIAYRNQIEAAQRAVRGELASRGIRITGSVSTLLNAIFVIAPASRLSEMLAIPGVAAVRPQRQYHVLLNRATQLMNAPAAWAALGGQANAGNGIKIAIIDTGIDQTHPAFQNFSQPMPSGFPKCTTGHPEDCAFANNKVIVARSYVRQLAGFTSKDPVNTPDDTSVPPAPATSEPDDYSPRDRDGHGTATASSAAADQNTGPALASNGGNITFTGMAPGAYLGNYKIFGTTGVNDSPTSDVMIMAINDALKDGMDVASLSVGAQALSGALDTGAACGLPAGQPCDPVAAAYEAAAKAGLVVVAAAGNSGSDAALLYGENYPYFNSISSPASAPSVIGVGATLNSHALTPSVSVNAPGAPANVKGLAAETGDSTFTPSLQGANAAPLIDVSQLGNDGYACTSLPAYSLTGSYALIERGPASNPCTFRTKEQNAQAAGAIGIIFYMYDSSPPISPSAASFTGPTVMVSNSDGLALKNYIDANPGQVVTIDAAGQETALDAYNSQNGLSLAANQLASYSSFGPTPDGAIKPDVVATGGLDGDLAFSPGMYLAVENYDQTGELYSVNRYAAADGTSFATPLVAGAAALVKQAHPNYTTAQIKSALVNSAAQDTTTDDGHIDGTGTLQPPQPVNVEWLGAGRLDAGAAVNASLAVDPATISFGYLKTGSLPITKTLTVTNRGSSAVSVAVSPNQQAAGANVAVDQTSIAAGATVTLKVTLSGSLPAAGSYSGAVVLTAGSTASHVPYLFLVPDGNPYNVVPLAFGAIQGTPGQDGGTIAIQAVDQYGVPVSGVPIAFSVSPRNSVTFQTVQGEPACSPNNTSAATCATDRYGIAYAEVILGSSPGSPTVTATPPSATSVSPFQFGALILPPPTITPGQILDNAAFQPKIAPGSIVAIKGSSLMDQGTLVNTTQGYDLSTTSPYPLALDGVNVSFDVPGAGISVPAPIVAVSPGQINVQVPWELKGQSSAQVKVIVDEAYGAPIFGNVVTASLADYTPAFFTNSGNVADALDTNNHVITSSNPAVRGQFISLFANALGPVSNTPPDGAPAVGTSSTTLTQPVVMIGGQQATVQFSGLAPGFTVYQVNVQVPPNLSAGNQPITIAIGGQTSPSGIVIPVQ